MSRLTRRNSGDWRYLAKTSSHSAWLSGGTIPKIGSHSTIESPEPVSRVMPPSTTMAKTRPAHRASHSATARRWEGVAGPAALAISAVLVKGRRDRSTARRPRIVPGVPARRKSACARARRPVPCGGHGERGGDGLASGGARPRLRARRPGPLPRARAGGGRGGAAAGRRPQRSRQDDPAPGAVWASGAGGGGGALVRPAPAALRAGLPGSRRVRGPRAGAQGRPHRPRESPLRGGAGWCARCRCGCWTSP